MIDLTTKCRVAAVREHHRTIRGKRNHATGEAITESVNLGWFVHLDFGDGAPFAFSVGDDRPAVREGQTIYLTLSSENPNVKEI